MHGQRWRLLASSLVAIGDGMYLEKVSFVNYNRLWPRNCPLGSGEPASPSKCASASTHTLMATSTLITLHFIGPRFSRPIYTIFLVASFRQSVLNHGMRESEY